MNGSPALENDDIANGSDRSSLLDLSSPRDLPDNFRGCASAKAGKLAGEILAHLASDLTVGSALSVSQQTTSQAEWQDTLDIPTEDMSHLLSSMPVITVSEGGGEKLVDQLVEQIPTFVHVVSSIPPGESLKTMKPMASAHKESPLGSPKENQGVDQQKCSRASPKEIISQRNELPYRAAFCSPIRDCQSQPSGTNTEQSAGNPNNLSGAFTEFATRSENAQTRSLPRSSCSQDELQTTASSSRSTLSDISEPATTFSAVSSQVATPIGAGLSLPTAFSSTPNAFTSSTVMPTLHIRPSLQITQARGAQRSQEAQDTRETQDTQDEQGTDSARNARDDLRHLPLACSLPASPLKIYPSKQTSYKVRPKASIPLDLTPQEYAGQCAAAAESSRLNPYALHEEEHAMLRQHISYAQVTTYLNIRNGILRLWMLRPHIAITRNEALGCSKETRWFDIASVCFDWLVRRGYVNYGCVDIKELQKDNDVAEPSTGFKNIANVATHARRKRIVVIGAGMAGLGCARQLHNLFKQYGDWFGDFSVEVPEVVVLEGRNRIGGRVYSRAFQIQPRHRHPDFQQSRCTAEMGGMIVTGFDRGNPMNTLVRGQLGLGYHALLSTTTIYDSNGKPVDAMRDGMVENLFNECLDRASEYKFKIPVPKVIEGSHSHMDEGRDGPSEVHRTIASVEDVVAPQSLTTTAVAAAVIMEAKLMTESQATTEAPGMPGPAHRSYPTLKTGAPPQVDPAPAPPDRPTGPAHPDPGALAALKAAHKVKIMGWALKPGVFESRDLDLDPAARTAGATLGFVVEDAIRQYGQLIDLNAQDFRLLNWHIANLEYSNAINHNRLSLGGWDIDAGNEWEGKHSMIIGGYQSVPRGLMLCPTPLDVRRRMVVEKITYNGSDDSGHVEHVEAGKPSVVIECEHGNIFEADYVVNTIPLGVLKHGNIEFSPPLPKWKADSIDRLGYGVLNKVILTYRQPFWDTERDIFGVLREPANRFSLDQKEYSQRRGRMFQWFNVSKTTGIPCLVALMAGDAAFDTEKASNDELVAEATSVLRSVFGAKNVPEPIEAVVTRWASDKFARGSYSSAGPCMNIDDYDLMARPVGKHLYFAGEHTIGTHPATVHGAYLSGLRAASEIFEELLGPIKIPTPLIPPKKAIASGMKRKRTPDEEEEKGGNESSASISASGGGSGCREAKASSRKRLEAREMRIQKHIHSHIRNRPPRPPRVSHTSYILFSKANYDRARQKCEEGRRPGKGRPLPNEVRVLTSKMWRSASAEERRPFAEQAAAQKQVYEMALKDYHREAIEWDRRAKELRAAYEKEHPKNGEQGTEGTPQSAPPSVTGSTAATPDRPSPFSGRQLRRIASYQTGDDSDVDMSG